MNIFERSILTNVRGWVAGLLLAHGWLHGFNWPIMAGTVAMFVLHHFPEILAEVKKFQADADAGDLSRVLKDFSELRDQVNVLRIAAAMKRPVPNQPSDAKAP